ncbi:hypothetical protein GGH96_003627 [Coemansia sp. RSA 1972]|nr:hypothetical protein GGH96_003627 [Coemansia sp. RSA 1972]
MKFSALAITALAAVAVASPIRNGRHNGESESSAELGNLPSRDVPSHAFPSGTFPSGNGSGNKWVEMIKAWFAKHHKGHGHGDASESAEFPGASESGDYKSKSWGHGHGNGNGNGNGHGNGHGHGHGGNHSHDSDYDSDNESGHHSLDSFFSELESLSNIDDVTGLPEFSNIFPSGLPSDFPSVIPGDIPSDLPSGIPSNLPIDPVPSSSVEDASVENSQIQTEDSSSSVQFYTTYGTSELDELLSRI